MDCKSCKETYEENARYYHESEMTGWERANFRLWLTNILLIIGIIAGIIWFEWRESQFVDETVTIEAEQESETGSNYAVGGDLYG